MYKTLSFLGDGGDLYLVSSTGKVWTKKAGMRKKPVKKWRRKSCRKDKDGYLHVTLFLNKKPRDFLVHRLVLMAFIGSCPTGKECRHLDGVRWNNNLTNLCWGSHEEQYEDRRKHGTSNAGIHINVGENHPLAKLTRVEVEQIRSLYDKKSGITMKVLAKRFGVTLSMVSHIIRRVNWR